MGENELMQDVAKQADRYTQGRQDRDGERERENYLCNRQRFNLSAHHSVFILDHKPSVICT